MPSSFLTSPLTKGGKRGVFGAGVLPLFAAESCTFTLASDASKKEPVDQEMKALQGSWQLVDAESAGRPVPKQQIQGVKLVISGTQMKLESGGESSTGTFTIDPAKKPKAIDSTINFDGDRGKTLGIYALEGDTLKLCCSIDGKTRPKALATTPTEAVTLWTYKRAKP